jgi:hypothetical protein
VKYVKIEEAEIDEFEDPQHQQLPAEPEPITYEANFRINAMTDFDWLGKVASSYWGIGNVGDMLIAQQNFKPCDLSSNVVKAMADENLPPEFWFYERSKVNQQIIQKLSLEQEIDEEDDDEIELKKEEIEYNQILMNYPGLESYIPYRSKESIEKENEKRLRSRESSCCTFMVIVVLFSLTIVVILGRVQLEFDYWIQQGMTNLLLREYEVGQNFYDIKNFNDMNEFYIKVVSDALFVNAEGKHFLNNAKFVGTVRLR